MRDEDAYTIPDADRAGNDPELGPGDRVGPYVVDSVIGRGGCGTVYAGQHPILGRKAAIKVMRRALAEEHTMVHRFVQEARTANLIRHPNIVDIFDIGTTPDGCPYYVMELLEGETLDRVVVSQSRLRPVEVLAILEPVADALDAAHRQGVVHRDLKPSNIFLARDREGERVIKLLDFGIAKLIHRDPGEINLTTTQKRLGTPQFMAPEQIRGQAVDPRTDVYALAVTMFVALTGRLPFPARDFAEAERQHLEREVPRPSSLAPVSAAVDEVVRHGMRKRPDERPATAGALVAELRAAIGGSGHAAAATAPNRVALAILVHASPRPGAAGDPDLEAIDLVFDLEERVRAAGYVVALSGGPMLLAVRPCPADAGDALREALALADRAVAAASPAVKVQILVRRGDAAVDAKGAHGPLLHYTDWLPAVEGEGVFVGRDLAGLLGAGDAAPELGDFVRAPVRTSPAG
ncbi:MAG TPA: serine/threonine-protein kinase [Kofleriaceae bacterium]|nr:serine/threonine-protein kinase [Kofleriaceae bacterium]